MESLLQALARHLAEAPEYGQHPLSPATAKQRASVATRCQKRLGSPVPVGYLQLLARVNGFIYNGLTIFAAKPRVLAGERPVTLEGFIEENEGIRIDRPHFAELLVFGSNDLADFVYRIADGGFLVLSRIGEDVFETFDTFEELLAHALESASAQ